MKFSTVAFGLVRNTARTTAKSTLTINPASASHAAAIKRFAPRTSLLAVTMSAALLAACGGGGSDSNADDVADKPLSEAAEAQLAQELAGSMGTAEAKTAQAASKDSGEDDLEKGGWFHHHFPFPFPFPPRPSQSDNPTYRWNELALETVRAGNFSDAQAARLYA